jgi:hypothetical protein
MRLLSMRFTIRRMMVAVALVGLSIPVVLKGWEDWQERQRVRNRIARQQRLLRSIGEGNLATEGMAQSPERSSTPIISEEMKRRAEAELREAEEAVRNDAIARIK